MKPPRVLMIDHTDSFVFILADQFRRLGADVRVYRPAGTVREMEERIRRVDPALVVLSPGPGRPEDAASTVGWLQTLPSVPVLGVCLGHQAMAVAYGGTVVRAAGPVHGRPWPVRLFQDPLFAGFPRRFTAARYHSLVVGRMPADFEVIATSMDGDRELVMAMRHRTMPQVGLQFHPESYLTPLGGVLVERILDEAVGRIAPATGPAEARAQR